MLRKPKTAFATFDGAAARAYLYERAAKRLTLLPGFPMTGQKKPEFSDQQGRMFSSADDRRSAAEPPSDPEQLIERRFVADVAKKLEVLKAKKAFDRLIVAAGPRALGYWRETAPKELAASVKREVVSDYAHLDETALLPLVENAFWG